MALVGIVSRLKLHKPIVIINRDDPLEHLLSTLVVEAC
jgi:hypothetical protein